MTIVINIFISFLIFMLLLSTLFLIRNVKVCAFRNYILNASYNHVQDYWDDINWDKEDWFVKYTLHETASSFYQQIVNKYEYNEMLFSIKPLRLDEWFTEEEIEFIEFGTLN